MLFHKYIALVTKRSAWTYESTIPIDFAEARRKWSPHCWNLHAQTEEPNETGVSFSSLSAWKYDDLYYKVENNQLESSETYLTCPFHGLVDVDGENRFKEKFEKEFRPLPLFASQKSGLKPTTCTSSFSRWTGKHSLKSRYNEMLDIGDTLRDL